MGLAVFPSGTWFCLLSLCGKRRDGSELGVFLGVGHVPVRTMSRGGRETGTNSQDTIAITGLAPDNFCGPEPNVGLGVS
jgi:hypothetical protein